MNKPTYHILLCTSSRVAGEPKGACQMRNATTLIQYLQEGIDERGIENVLVTNTGCLKQCSEGAVLVVYPQGHWYGHVDEDVIDALLDALAEGHAVEELLLC